jgi:hypothetical protein
VVAYTAGMMKKNRIKTLAGDRMTIEMSPYDLQKGRLVFRHKDEHSGAGRRPQSGSASLTRDYQQHVVQTPAKLGDFRRICVKNRKIRLQIKF